jgi:hypothetical protein
VGLQPIVCLMMSSILLIAPSLVVIIVAFTSGFSLTFPPSGYSTVLIALTLVALVVIDRLAGLSCRIT